MTPGWFVYRRQDHSTKKGCNSGSHLEKVGVVGKTIQQDPRAGSTIERQGWVSQVRKTVWGREAILLMCDLRYDCQ